jgi:hypothetical protein
MGAQTQVGIVSYGPPCPPQAGQIAGNVRIFPKYIGWVEEQVKKYDPCEKAAPLVDCTNPIYSLPAAQKGRKVYLVAGGKANADEYCK